MQGIMIWNNHHNLLKHYMSGDKTTSSELPVCMWHSCNHIQDEVVFQILESTPWPTEYYLVISSVPFLMSIENYWLMSIQLHIVYL